jgi:hypothetical protein
MRYEDMTRDQLIQQCYLKDRLLTQFTYRVKRAAIRINTLRTAVARYQMAFADHDEDLSA